MGAFECSLSVSGEGSEYAITVAELKDNLRIDYYDDDPELATMVEAAARWIESNTNLHIMQRTFTWKFDAFPDATIIRLPVAPVQSITSITYTDSAGNTGQTLATTVYGFDGNGPTPVIYQKADQVWPDTYDERNSVTVVGVSGYANTGDSPVSRANIPEPLRRAHLLVASDYYRNRVGTVQSQFVYRENPAVEAILAHYREHWF